MLLHFEQQRGGPPACPALLQPVDQLAVHHALLSQAAPAACPPPHVHPLMQQLRQLCCGAPHHAGTPSRPAQNVRHLAYHKALAHKSTLLNNRVENVFKSWQSTSFQGIFTAWHARALFCNALIKFVPVAWVTIPSMIMAQRARIVLHCSGSMQWWLKPTMV